MIGKWKATIVSILMSLTMISVGFSSWSLISIFEGETLTGEIQADQIVKTDEYLSFDTTHGGTKVNQDTGLGTGTGIEIFDYASTGFIWYEYINADGTTFDGSVKTLTFNSTKARIILYFTLAGVDYSAIFGNNGIQIDIDITLRDNSNQTVTALSNVKSKTLNAFKGIAGASENTAYEHIATTSALSFTIEKPEACSLAVLIDLETDTSNFINLIKTNIQK